MRTCPASGSGISRSTLWKSAPGPETCATFICLIFIGTTVALLAAINPPMNFQPLLKSFTATGEATEHCSATLPCHFENDFQFDRRAERKACDAIHQTARVLVFSEDVL